MAHVKRFQGIPMSKSMRGICREEDYAFLGERERGGEGRRAEEPGTLDPDWSDRREERIRRRREREQQERERLRGLEESKKEKEQQWRSHIAQLATTQEHALRDRLARLRRFREFQRKVLEESGLIPKSTSDTADEPLSRM